MNNDLISRSALLDAMRDTEFTTYFPLDEIDSVIDCAPAVDAEPVITGETSDGYHTFNELYHHRAVLFSVIVKAFPERAWKARQHHDGTMYEGMFIVGIDTPDGQASYHYDIDPYWDMFDCRELERAPEWDGHTPAQAIERIGRLEPVRRGRWIFKVYDERINYRWNVKAYCSECCDEEQEIWAGFFPGVPDFMAHDIALDNAKTVKLPNYCQTCGAKMARR